MSLFTDPNIRTLIEALLRLPEGARVVRVERDEREERDWHGLDFSHYTGRPQITIQIDLPRTERGDEVNRYANAGPKESLLMADDFETAHHEYIEQLRTIQAPANWESDELVTDSAPVSQERDGD